MRGAAACLALPPVWEGAAGAACVLQVMAFVRCASLIDAGCESHAPVRVR